MKTYLFRYFYNGDEYGFEIPADTEREARMKVVALQRTAEYDGELAAKIPAYPGAGPLVRLWCWIKNGGQLFG